MAGFVVDGRYAAKVESGSRLVESESNNTPGVEMRFNCGDHGTIGHVEWLTPNRIEIAERHFNALGVSSDDLRSEAFWTEIGKWIDGASCEITIGEDEYKGKKRLTVKFINGARKAAPAGTAKYAASLFGGGSSPTPTGWSGPTDDEVPPPAGRRYSY